MSRIVTLLGRVLALPIHLVRWIGRRVGRLLQVLFAPLIRRIDSSDALSVLINSLSSSMATQRGLLLMIGTGILIVSVVVHALVIGLMVATNSFDRNLYLLCLPAALLHVGVLAGFTGAMLAIPLGQGYKDDQ